MGPVGCIIEMNFETGKNEAKLDPNYELPACLRNRGPEVTPIKKEPPKAPSTTQSTPTKAPNVDKTGKQKSMNDSMNSDLKSRKRHSDTKLENDSKLTKIKVFCLGCKKEFESLPRHFRGKAGQNCKTKYTEKELQSMSRESYMKSYQEKNKENLDKYQKEYKQKK